MSSQVRPSSSRPRAFAVRPPHCLKKNGTFSAVQRSRMSLSQPGSGSLQPGPDSPPAITHPMPARSRPSSGPSSGSQDKNRSAAASTARRLSTRASALASSTDTPTHKFGGHSSFPAILGSRDARLVRTW